MFLINVLKGSRIQNFQCLNRRHFVCRKANDVLVQAVKLGCEVLSDDVASSFPHIVNG